MQSAPTPDPPKLSELVDADDFGRRYTPDKPRSKTARNLYQLLDRLDPRATHEAKLDWIEELGDWVHATEWRGSGTTATGSIDDGRTRRVRLLLKVLHDVEPVRRRFAGVVASVFAGMRIIQLFSDVGLPMEPGFWREAMDRLADHLLPAPPDPYRFAEFLPRFFTDPDDADWLESAPREVLLDFSAMLADAQDDFKRASNNLRSALGDAVAILSARICALGLAQDIRDRLPDRPVRELPFLRLPRVCEALQGATPAATLMRSEQARQTIAACREALAEVLRHGDRFGVSVDLVYRVELMRAQLGRLEDLLVQLVPGFFADPGMDLGHLLGSVVRAHYQGRSLRALFRRSSEMLARKIIERTGHSGEHYITRTRREWWRMLGSAAGGGVLTAGTTVLKVAIAAMTLPMFFAGFFASANYAGSFLLMQWLGFTLATKQPAMTAAALAGSIETKRRGRRADSASAMRRLDKLVDMTACISRSQFAAALGNVLCVVPTALAFDALWRLVTKHHFLGEEKARHTVESLNLLASPTIFYAAYTGVLLWASSIFAGWLENWAVYHRLPDALAHHRQLGFVFGRERMQRFSKAFAGALSGIGGNVALGVFLGMTVPVASFFGLPLDVRHVTLSTGSLALSGAALGWRACLRPGFVFAALGVIAIGFLNFGVSFACALFVALRARDLRRSDVTVLARTFFSRLRKSTASFWFPPKDPIAAAEVAPDVAVESAKAEIAREAAAPTDPRAG